MTANKHEPHGVARAYRVVERMANAGGCAWHEAQTHETLTKYLVEEAYEFIDAIETATPEEIAEELGDVLYQVLFHAAIAARDNEGYDIDTVGEALADKLIARHPHVFGDRGYMSESELNAEWEHLKEAAQGEARGSRHPLEGIPRGMVTLARAAKVVERLKRAQLIEPSGDPLTETELGDEMMALMIRANANGLDPDRALRLATQRFANAHLNDTQLGEKPPESMT